jgi:hypothetical protein
MGNGKNLPQHGNLKTIPQFAMLKDFTEKNLRRPVAERGRQISSWPKANV